MFLWYVTAQEQNECNSWNTEFVSPHSFYAKWARKDCGEVSRVITPNMDKDPGVRWKSPFTEQIASKLFLILGAQ